MCSSDLCPVLITPIISLYYFRQGAALNRALRKLAEAHHLLEGAYAAQAEFARRDGLTGLLNRTAFFNSVGDKLKHRSEGALLIADADLFKQINDSFGHAAGDATLQAIARAIDAAAGPDAIVARLGGEEFGIYLDNSPPVRAAYAADAIRASVASLAVEIENNGRLAVTISIGAVMSSPGKSVEDLYRAADTELYVAKHAGRNRVEGFGSRLAA